MTIRSRYIFLWYCILLPCLLSAQSGWSEYTRYTRDEGLPTNYVYGVLEDDEGIIWAYTEEGIARFNGKEFEVFNTQNGLPANDIFLLMKDDEGRLFPGCFNCPAFYFENGHWVVPEENNPVDRMMIPKWFEKKQMGLLKSKTYLEHQTFTPAKGWELKEYDHYFARLAGITLYEHWGFLLPSPDAAHQIFLEDTVLTFQSQLVTELFVEKFNRENFYNASISVDRTLFAVLSNQLFLWNLTSGEEQMIDLQGKAKLGRQGWYPNGNPYFSCPEFFWEFNEKLEKIDSFSRNQLSFPVILTRPYKDQNGNLWLGSKNGGLFFFRALDRQNVHLETGQTTDNAVRFFQPTQKGELLAFTDAGVILEWDSDKRIFFKKNSFENQGRLRFLNGVQATDFDYFSLGLQGGQMFYDAAGNKVVPNVAIRDEFLYYSFKSGSLNQLHLKGGKTVIIHGRAKLLKVDLEQETFKVLAEKAPLQTLIDNDDNVFVLWEDRVDALPAGSDSLSTLVVTDLAGRARMTVTPNGQLWLISLTGNLYFLEDGVLNEISGFKKFANVTFWENEFSLWLGTSEGVFHLQFSPENLQNYTVTHYHQAHGLKSEKIVSLYVSDDFIFAGHDRGIDAIDRDLVQDASSLEPKLLVNTCKYGAMNEALSPGAILSFQDNNVEIQAELVSYESKGDFHFEYRLQEQDSVWIKNQNGQISLNNLDPGGYQFQLKGVDAFGNNSEIFEMPFRVQRVWYLQGRFLFLFALLVVGLSVFISWYASRRVIQKVSREQEVRSRIHELKLQALRSQMNPHFIFNALGSIQYYIQTRKVEEADEYLSDFARLMRLILESAQSQMTCLEDEIELLRLYIRLEHIRFEQQFDFEVIEDPDLDPDFKIPSMLLQPFVENAINHGLYHLQGRPGKLEVEFTAEDENTLICRIEDNGIGREKAKTLRKHGHRSRGMELIQEQLESLQAVSHLQTQIETIDLKNPIGQPGGTRVLIKLAYV